MMADPTWLQAYDKTAEVAHKTAAAAGNTYSAAAQTGRGVGAWHDSWPYYACARGGAAIAAPGAGSWWGVWHAQGSYVIMCRQVFATPITVSAGVQHHC
jgi:hypothetical protein